jgi:hypothetical protein
MRSDAMLSPLKPNDCAQGEKRNYWPEPPVLLCRWDGFWHLVAQQYRTGLQRGRSPCWRPQSQLSTRTLNTAPAAALSSSSVNAAAPPMPSRTWTATTSRNGDPPLRLGLGRSLQPLFEGPGGRSEVWGDRLPGAAARQLFYLQCPPVRPQNTDDASLSAVCRTRER